MDGETFVIKVVFHSRCRIGKKQELNVNFQPNAISFFQIFESN